MYVEVFETTPDGQEPWFRVTYEDGKVDMSEAPEKLQTAWDKYGIPYRGTKVKPDDGEEFLRAVASDLNGSMARSNDVIEGDGDTLRNTK